MSQLKHAVDDDLLGEIFVEDVGLLFVNIESQVANVSGLEATMSALASTSPPRLVLIIITFFLVSAMVSSLMM